MTDDHLSPTDLDPHPDPPRFHSRHFARLVGSPTARRFSPRRSVVAVLVGIGVLGGGVLTLDRCGRALADWVARQPEHQIAFATIELTPPAPSFIPAGSAGILESVRLDARYSASISVLATDLDALRVDLSRNPWIESVPAVRRAHRQLAVDVVYRQPLALIMDPGEKPVAVLDRQGVELPVDSLQPVKVDGQTSYHVTGDGNHLIPVCRLGLGLPGRVGLTWKSADPAIGAANVTQAIQLARFLQDLAPQQIQGMSIPPFSIHYHAEAPDHPDGTSELIKGFFLRDPDQRWVFWGAGPGSEERDEPKATEKWANLVRFFERYGTLKTKLDPDHFLSLRSRKAVVLRAQTDPKGRAGSVPGR